MFERLLMLALVAATALAQYNKAPRQQNSGFEVIAQWNQLEFGFPTPADQQNANRTGNLVPENGTPIDVAVQYAGKGQQRIFTTIPRFVGGIPYTLATVSMQRGQNGPLLQPYPNFEWHNQFGANCDQITSAFRVAINECNQMWVIDSGAIGTEQRCSPQLLLFDLNTDQLLHRYRFPADLYVPRASLFITPLVVVEDPPPRGRCARTKVYVADVTFHGLVVYDQPTNTAWRIENRFMYPDPDLGVHTIAGENFTLMDGMFAINTDKRNLYFHPLASMTEYSVPLSVLNDRNNWLHGVEAMEDQFVVLGKRKSECAASAMDSRGNLYCVTFNPIKLIVWNNKSRYDTRNFGIVPSNPNELEFVSGMKVALNAAGKEELQLLSNRFQKISAGTFSSNEVNFRILRRTIDDAQNFASNGNDLSNRLIFT